MNSTQQANEFFMTLSPHRLLAIKLIGLLEIEEGQTIVDVGCTVGTTSVILSGYVAPTGRVIGIERNKQRLDYGKDLYAEHKNVEFVNCSYTDDLCAITGLKGNVDIVIANSLLHWLPNDDIKVLFKQAFDLLKPNNKSRFGVQAGQHFTFIQRFDEICGSNLQSRVNNQDVSNIVEYAKEAGFTVKVCQTVDSMQLYSFPEFDTFVHWYTGLTQGAFNLENLSEEQVAQVQDIYDNIPKYCGEYYTLILEKP
jgi:SAM-dependent methyltransferase